MLKGGLGKVSPSNHIKYTQMETDTQKEQKDQKDQRDEKSRIIGKGGYGCVFTPPLPCRRSKSKKLIKKTKVVGKVMKKDDSEIELNIGTLVKAIPGYERYYIVLEEDNCDTKNFQKLRKEYFSNCPTIQSVKNNDLQQLLSKYGGRSLHSISITPSFDFMDSFRHVLEGISKLNNQGICHLDIKLDNLLIDMNGTVRIIDFGISFLGDESTEQTVLEHQFPFSPEYDGFPPELTVQEGLVKGMNLNFAIQQSVIHKRILQTASNLLGMNIYKQQEDLRRFWKADPIWQESGGRLWAKWFQAYWRAWDSWAVGVVFLKLLQKSFLLPSFINTIWKENGTTIKIVLQGLLQTNPMNRLTATEALELLKTSSS